MIDDYIGIGGNAVEQEANEGIADIPGNRTLMVNQMTAEEPGVPEIVDHLYTIEKMYSSILIRILMLISWIRKDRM